MSGKKRATQTDWAKVDAYVLGPKDYEEIPEQTEEDFARGVPHIGGVPVPRGRPKSARAKQPVSLRLDAEVIAHFRRAGRGCRAASTPRCARPPSCRRRRRGRREGAIAVARIERERNPGPVDRAMSPHSRSLSSGAPLARPDGSMQAT